MRQRLLVVKISGDSADVHIRAVGVKGMAAANVLPALYCVGGRTRTGKVSET